MSTPKPSELFAQIETLLDGIDRHEDHPSGGWWQTPDGARIGSIKLRELKELITSHLATPPAATREAKHDDGDDVIDRWVDSKSNQISNWAAPRSDIAALIGEALEHWGRSATREVGIAPHRELVEEWLSEIWHEGTPVLTSASDMHIAARAADWARAQQATREAGPLPQAGNEGPTKAELFQVLMQSGGETRAVSVKWLEPFARAVLARWGGAAVQPVPLDNRPWEQPDWCDEEGNCWVGYPLTWCDEEGNCWAEYPSITKNLYKIRPEWLSTNPTYISSRKDSRAEFVVLLPHWALPVPAADEGEGQR